MIRRDFLKLVAIALMPLPTAHCTPRDTYRSPVTVHIYNVNKGVSVRGFKYFEDAIRLAYNLKQKTSSYIWVEINKDITLTRLIYKPKYDRVFVECNNHKVYFNRVSQLKYARWFNGHFRRVS